jgi:hypothetical protein
VSRSVAARAIPRPAGADVCHVNSVRSTLLAAQRGPGERANAQLKSWRVLRKIRCCPLRATSLVKAVLAVILAS